MSEIMNSVNYHPGSIPDHSALLCEVKCDISDQRKLYYQKVVSQSDTTVNEEYTSDYEHDANLLDLNESI